MGLHEHFLEPLGFLFYIVDRKKHTYYNLEDVPAYIDRVIPLFIGAILLEAAVASARGRRNLLDFFETVCSLSTGLVQAGPLVGLRQRAERRAVRGGV